MAYIHTCIHTYIHTYIYTYIQATYMAYIHTYIRDIHTVGIRWAWWAYMGIRWASIYIHDMTIHTYIHLYI